MVLDNAAPQVYNKAGARVLTESDLDDDVDDQLDVREIFDLIRNIKDPEHPLSLEELNVVREDLISIDTQTNTITVDFTPTIAKCSMAPLIGLTIIVKLLRTLPIKMKIDVHIAPGSHVSEEPYNRQLNDKERVAAALENTNLLGVINGCIATH